MINRLNKINRPQIGGRAAINEGLIPRVNGFDWHDSNADGIGNGWTKSSGAGACQIITGNGFTGNAQQINHILDTETSFYYSTGVNRTVGKSYKIKLKYRTNSGNWRIYLGLSDELVVSSLAYNDGAAASVEYTIVSSRSTEAILQFRRLSEYANSYIEIDEVQLIEQ